MGFEKNKSVYIRISREVFRRLSSRYFAWMCFIPIRFYLNYSGEYYYSTLETTSFLHELFCCEQNKIQILATKNRLLKFIK